MASRLYIIPLCHHAYHLHRELVITGIQRIKAIFSKTIGLATIDDALLRYHASVGQLNRRYFFRSSSPVVDQMKP